MRPYHVHSIFFVCVLLIGGLLLTPQTFAQNKVDELQTKINERNNQIQALEAEIATYNKEVERVGKEAKTLQNTIKTLDLTQKKVNTDLTLTTNKISKTSLTIEDLGNNIVNTGVQIDSNVEAIRDLLNEIYQTEIETPVETFLQYKTFTDMWNNLENLKQVQRQIKFRTDDLANLKVDLADKKTKTEAEKERLKLLQENLADQKKIVEYNKQEKAKVLAQTKNTESAYKTLLKQKEAQKDAFEKELYAYESQLKLEVDPSRLPASRAGILSWPLDKVIVTQRFGQTSASKRLYVSGSHNGADFGAPTGTPVKSALDGVVVGTGNTDAYPGCYSFGKWVMVKHPNGLSTIYAHLSVIKAVTGQSVSTGEVIGYSGNTGYSTGPHLHLGVYATQGVRIEKYVNSRGCKEATIPLADIKAYLDPFEYLPEL
ncbi:MAG: murein hydrolase activator EnvC family protein [Minisyncoccota bacterium]